MLGRIAIITVAIVAATGGTTVAQEATPPACEGVIGRHTVEGVEFAGSEPIITEPFALQPGVLFAEVSMGAAGSAELVNAAGDSILIGNGSEPYDAIEAAEVRQPGDYYLVIDFYSAQQANWTVALEQPGT